MNRNKRKFGFVNIGTASLLVVFLTLCLVAFAMLSLSTAKNDYEFSKKLAERTTVYYEEKCASEFLTESGDSL